MQDDQESTRRRKRVKHDGDNDEDTVMTERMCSHLDTGRVNLHPLTIFRLGLSFEQRSPSR